MAYTNDVLISIHPKYAAAIVDGSKTVEIRRRFPRMANHTRLWIYATMPIGAIIGTAYIEQIERNTPNIIWDNWGSKTGISRTIYNEYLEGVNSAVAVLLMNVSEITPITLTRIREVKSGFTPPQVTSRLIVDDVRNLLLLANAQTSI